VHPTGDHDLTRKDKTLPHTEIEPRSFSLSYPGAPHVYKGKESALDTHTHTHINTRREGLYMERRKQHNDELKDLYYSPNIVRVIKSRRILRAGHVARMWRVKAYTGFWWGNQRERTHLEEPGADGRKILRWIFRKWDVRAWTRSSRLRIGTDGELS
jgi:hypothetical protein